MHHDCNNDFSSTRIRGRVVVGILVGIVVAIVVGLVVAGDRNRGPSKPCAKHVYPPLHGAPNTLHQVKPVQGANVAGSQGIGHLRQKNFVKLLQTPVDPKNVQHVENVQLGALECDRAIDPPKPL